MSQSNTESATEDHPTSSGATPPKNRRVFTWLSRWSDWKRWWQIPLLLVILYLPAFSMGQVMDDYHFESTFRHGELSLDLLFNSFNFGESEDAEGKLQRHRPWWSAPDHKMQFFRPAATFTLWLDYHLLSLPLRHLHSLLWYGFLLWGLAGFYRLALRPWRTQTTEAGQPIETSENKSTGLATPEKIAFLAWVLFAVNDAHTLPVAWVAHRSLIIAVGFAVWALRYFEAGLRGEASHWIGPVFFMLALTGGEAALGILAYMGLRILFSTPLNPGDNKSVFHFPSLIKQFMPLVPYAVITGVYLILYSLGGFGTFQSGLYLNPLREPVVFLIQFVQSWPVLMGALLGPISASTYGLREAFPIIVWFVVPAGFFVFALNWYYLRPFRDRTGAFLFGGAMLALIPACMAAPGDRLLMMAGIGAYPLLARFLLERRGWFWWALLVGHLILSALNVTGISQFFSDYGAYAREKIEGLKAITPPETPKNRKLVLINGPGICLGLQFRHIYGAHLNDVKTENFLLMANNLSETRLTRIDATTIEVVTVYPGKSGARVFRRENNHMTVNEPIEKDLATARVMEMDNKGWPARVRFQFKSPLNELAFVAFWGDDYRYITPPAIGETIVVPAPDNADSKLYL